MAKKTVKRRGGVVRREVTKFVLRLDPSVADRLAVLAGEVGLSRNQYIEQWLTAIVEADSVRSEGDDWQDFGHNMISAFVSRGLRGSRGVKHG